MECILMKLKSFAMKLFLILTENATLNIFNSALNLIFF